MRKKYVNRNKLRFLVFSRNTLYCFIHQDKLLCVTVNIPLATLEASGGKMRLRWKFRIHPRTRFTTYYPNPLWIHPPARTFDFPLFVASTLCPQCALRFKFCHGTNCLTNRIFAIATNHRRSKLDISCVLFFIHFSFCFVLYEARFARIQSTYCPKWFEYFSFKIDRFIHRFIFSEY